MTRSQANPQAPRRALVFAGGGVKVAYQAGAVQVLLDEAGIEFDLADGASGGVFNLAMWCQGMTGRQIADNWRNYQPLGDFSPNLGAWLRGPWGASVLTAGRLATPYADQLRAGLACDPQHVPGGGLRAI